MLIIILWWTNTHTGNVYLFSGGVMKFSYCSNCKVSFDSLIAAILLDIHKSLLINPPFAFEPSYRNSGIY